MTGIGQMMAAYFAQPEIADAMARREREREERARLIVEAYGSEKAVFAETPRELSLRAACSTVPGFDPHAWLEVSDELVAAAMRGWQMPANLAGVWTEYQEADKLESDRCTVEPDYSGWAHVEARRRFLEQLLNEAPAKSKADLCARAAWIVERQRDDLPLGEKLALALQSDINRLVGGDA